VHTAIATFATRLSRWWEFSANGGVARLENRFDEVVALDPVVAQLLGYASGTQRVYNVQEIPTFSGRLSRTFRRGVFWLSGGRTVTPGNGLFLASKVTNASMGYTYTGLRRWSFTAQAMYDRGDSMGNVVGEYGDYSGGLAISREILRSLHFVAGAEARHYQSSSFNQYNRNVYDAHIGLGWSPGAVPLRLW
jgi:hypothetical protein